MRGSILIFIGGLALFPRVALADIAPPRGYIESCTVEKQKRSGEECVSCSTFFAEADKCVREHGAKGFEFRCKTRGGSTWAEVWCKSGSRTIISSLQEPDAGAPAGRDSGAATPVSTAPPPSSTPTSPSAPPSKPNPAPPSETSEPNEPAHESADAAPHSSSAPPSTPKPGGCGACTFESSDSDWLAPALMLASLAIGALRRKRNID